MTYQIKNFPDKKALLGNLAETLVQQVADTLSTFKQCRIVVGGGKTPVELNHHVVEKCLHLSCDWSGLHIYFSDERMVPAKHPENTANMIIETLVNPLCLPQKNVHPIPTNMEAKMAADAYNQELTVLKNKTDGPLFNLSLLGLGPDGHTASLFPGSPALVERVRFATPGGKGPEGLERVTLTFRAIEQSDLIWIVAAGNEKQPAIDRLINGPWDPATCPAQGISHETKPVVLWLVRRSAI